MGVVVIALGGIVLVATGRRPLRWTRPARRFVGALVVVLSVGAALAGCDSADNGSGAPTTAAPGTAVPAPSPPAPALAVAPAPDAAAAAVWDALAQCEAGGDWAIDSGNGRYGGMQLRAQTWMENGGGMFAPLPSAATREQQIVVAERVRATQGFALWGSCATELGLE